MSEPRRPLAAMSPDAAARALVAEATGWPAAVADASPSCWSAVIMVGLRATLLDARWGIDPMTTRLVEGTVTASAPPPEATPVEVVATEVSVVDLGALAGLRLTIDVTDPSAAVVARAELTVGAQGTGLGGGERPPAPASAPSARGDAAWTGALDVSAAAVARFADWCGDDTAFHHDAAAAVAAGLPAPTAPGLFVLGLLAAASAEAFGRPVAAVSARFVRPTVLGQRLDVAVFDPADDGRVAVSATAPEGPVVRRAWTAGR